MQVETANRAKQAAYLADQQVAEQEARRRAEEAARVADGAIRVAEQNAQRSAEEARAAREEARLRAEVVVAAEAERERQIRVAQGAAEAVKLRLLAEAEGTRAVLEAKAQGYDELVKASGGSSQAASFLVVEKLVDVANVQAAAIKKLPLDKVVVWDSGSNGEGGLANLGKRIIGVLPPMHDVARLAGLELPEYLGKLQGEAAPDQAGNA